MKLLYYTTASGREPVKDFILSLPAETRIEILTLLRRIENGDVLQMPHSKSLASMASGLYELRVRDERGNIRLFYYVRRKDAVYLLHALRKKTRIISNKDRKLVLKRINEITE